MMNYKKIFMAATCLLMSLNLLAQQNTFTLTGKLANIKSGTKIYIFYYKPNLLRDSATVQNGTFEFKGTLTSPFTAQLFLPHGPKPAKIQLPLHGELDFFNLYIDEGLIKVNGIDSVKQLVITNSKINDEDKKLSETLDALQQKIKSLRDEFDHAPVEKKKDENFVIASNDKLLRLYEEIKEAKIQFAKENPNSYVSLNAVFELARSRSMNYHKIDTAYNLLSDRYKNTFLAKEAKKLINTGINTTVGSQALDITLPDANGKFFKLSDFKGKYVMLEFWASWCGPCRAENPNLIRAYEKYKDKKFTVFSISLDTKREAWLEAVEKDKIPYLQVSDLKGPQESEVAKSYGIQSIPESYLIDPNGKIIGKNLRGEVLNKKLAELFN